MIQVVISEHQTDFNSSENQSLSRSIAVGYATVVKQFFQAYPPNYDDVDAAINYIEEAVINLEGQFDDYRTAFTSDTFAYTIAKLAFQTTMEDGFIRIPRTELENVFSRFAAISAGLPASQDVLPPSVEFAAYLLILREIVHHLDFEEVLVHDVK